MKRRDLIKLLEANGWYFKREGRNHDIYTNGKDGIPADKEKANRYRFMSGVGRE